MLRYEFRKTLAMESMYILYQIDQNLNIHSLHMVYMFAQSVRNVQMMLLLVYFVVYELQLLPPPRTICDRRCLSVCLSVC